MHFAIVGAAVRLPGATNITQFWSQLVNGDIAVRRLSKSESAGAGLNDATLDHPNYVPFGTSIDDASTFDTAHFGVTPGDACLIDPQQRMLLKLGSEALQTAGITGSEYPVGTFVSTTASTYLMNRIIPARGYDSASLRYPVLLGNDKDFAGTRLAHKLGLQGPAMTVQTACSSSLVAVHQACASLQLGEVDAALVGGVSVSIPQVGGYVYSEGGIMSATGQCRPFDIDSDGTVKGNGGAVIIIKRLEDAVAQQDNILAVIRGSAVNNDGNDKIGFTAPSVAGQAQVIASALDNAEVDSSGIAYVETHGTGTKLGDPIEIRALDRAHRTSHASELPACRIGSLKASYGHLDAAAGIVGLLKAALVVHYREIPPQPNFTRENPDLRLGRTRFSINTDRESLDPDAAVAVSSFGMGGTNCHIILSGAPARTPAESENASVRITLTATSEQSLTRYRQLLAEHLEGTDSIAPADISATLRRRTERGTVRWDVTVSTTSELIAALRGNVVNESNGLAAAPDRTEHHGTFVWLPPTPFDETEVDLPTMAASTKDIPRPAASKGRPEREDVIAFALECIKEALGLSTLLPEDDFFESGGESITLVEIVGDVTSRYGLSVDFDRLDGLTVTGAIVDEIARQVSGDDSTAYRNATSEPLIVLNARENPFYLHPPAGGTNFCYTDLHRDAPDIGIRAFRAPHGETATSIEAIAARNIAILPAGPLPDLRIGGYSFGGNVAIEMALQLEQQGRPPAEVVLFDSHVPASYQGSGIADADYDRALDEIFRNATGTDGLSMAGLFERLGDDSDEPDTLSRFQKMWRSNHRSLTLHRPQGRTSARITVFRAAEQHPPAEFGILGITEVDKNAWQKYSTQPIRLVETTGNHYTMFTDPDNRRELARQWQSMFAERALVTATN